MPRFALVFLLGLLFISTPISAQAELSPQQLKTLARDLIQHHALPSYERLAATTQTLQRNINGFCQRKANFKLEGLTGAYQAAYASWMAVQHIRFGPVMKQDRYYRFHYWPDKHGQGARQLRKLLRTKDKPDITETTIGKMSVALQGFGALEWLLFGPGKPDFAGFKCKMIIAIGGNLANMARSLLVDWKSYKPRLDTETVHKFFRSFTDQLQTIKSLKLDRVLGKTLKKARPRRVENRWTKTSFNSIAANLKTLEGLFSGENGGTGLKIALESNEEDRGISGSISEGLRFGAQFALTQKLSLGRSVKNKNARKRVAFLSSHLQNLYESSAEYLAPALGVTLGFNALDGD